MRLPTLPFAALVTGFALGGLADGILLHQVLQWHHLLSLVENDGGPIPLGTQILVDGLFHIGMYAVLAYGLWRLWRDRAVLDHVGGGAVLAGTLVGFGLWNVVDAVAFHWVLGIHRIRVGVDSPLAYDLGWLFVFGVVPIAIALLLRRPPGDGRRMAAGVAVIGLVGAGWAATPPPDQPAAIVAFAPWVAPHDAARAVAATGRPIIWADRAGTTWAVPALSQRERATLLAAGGLPLTGWAAGCAGWSQV